jgi:aldehyde:ferredoxin oxidoreductase
MVNIISDDRFIVDIDLNTKKNALYPVPEKLKSKGGRYITSSLVAEETDPNIHPLSPENNLYIAPGFLSGTPCPSSGRASFGTKSPLTSGIKESNVGGNLGTYAAKLGIAAIKMRGSSGGANVIVIEEKEGKEGPKVSFETLNNIKGKETYEAVSILRENYGTDTCEVVVGPAGENEYASACICVTDVDGKPTRQAGRGGVGAVLGSKGIKAIVFKNPSKSRIEYNDKNKYMENVKVLVDILKKSDVTSDVLPNYGTIKTMDAVNDHGALPTRNFSDGVFEGVTKIGGEAMRKIILKRGANPTHNCMPGCIIKCSNTYNDKKGEEITGGFEYECIWALGANCGIDDLDYIAYMNRICDELGLDCIETGDTLAVIMESGYISFGDKKGAVKLLNEIRKNTALGRIVASGCTVAGKAFGVKRVPQVKGQGLPAYDPRGIKGLGTTFATSTMGADHTAGFTYAVEIGELGRTSDPLSNKGKIALSREFQQCSALLDSAGLCLFVSLATLADKRGLKPVAEMMNSKYGTSFNEDELLSIIGNEVLLTEKDFNRRCGFSDYSNDLPEFFRSEKLPSLKTVYDVSQDELINF